MNTSQSAMEYTSLRNEARSKWGWFVAVGFVFVVLGFLAFGNLLAATTASVFYVGALMIVGAIVNIVHAFQVKNWSGFLGWLLSGLLYGAAGATAFSNPLLAASVLTLILAYTLIISGIVRIWSSSQMRAHSGWGWVTASGLVTLLAGIVFVVGWPINTLWLLGMLLAFDLVFQGFATIALGLTLRS
jgi:uncharacterized membrane protein HdeD (DUF308 family)